MTTDLETNLLWARKAVHYVKERVAVGNAWVHGDFEDIGQLPTRGTLLALMKLGDYVTVANEFVRIQLYNKWGVDLDPHFWTLSPMETYRRVLVGRAEKQQDRFRRKEAEVLARAAVTEIIGIGNCAENAAVACMYLLRQRVRPIDYMIGGDSQHAFVVIGRVKGSKAAEPEGWGQVRWFVTLGPLDVPRTKYHRMREKRAAIQQLTCGRTWTSLARKG